MMADYCTPNRQEKEFHADLVILPSLSEEETVGPFLDWLRQILTENSFPNAVVTHCGDSRFSQGNFLQRSSVVLYLFTKSSAEKFYDYTRIHGFQDFLYKQSFIPVLGEKDVNLPMPAKVANPLVYCNWRDDKKSISSMVVNIYEKYRSVRLERGKCRSQKENTRSNKSKSEVPESEKNPPLGMNINATFVVIGDNNTVTTNPLFSEEDDDKDVRNQVRKTQSREESEGEDETRGDINFQSSVRSNGAKNTRNGRSQSIHQRESSFENENTLEKTVHGTDDDDETNVKEVYQCSNVCRGDHITSKNEEYQNYSKEGIRNQCSSSSDSTVPQYRHSDMKKSTYFRVDISEFCCTKTVTRLNDLSVSGRNGFPPEFIPNIQSEPWDWELNEFERNKSYENNL